MRLTSLAKASGYNSDSFVAEPLLDGSQSNVRVIRLSPGQTLPTHTHATSDLMLYAVEGSGTLHDHGDPVAFDEGSLAFLAPPFPPRSE